MAKVDKAKADKNKTRNKMNLQLKSWIWRWHIIGGLVSLPIVLLLCVTGMIYLFKAEVNTVLHGEVLQVQAPSYLPRNGQQKLPLQVQYHAALAAAMETANTPVVAVVIPDSPESATGFQLKGKGRAVNQVLVNPYSGEVTGTFAQRETLMYSIRKLHGELLLGKTGTLVVELVASWFAVLLITGVYIWWPGKSRLDKNRSNNDHVGGVFVVRTKAGKRVFWRDIHAVGGFWMALAMLVILAGGMPWTDVFGSNVKWLQKQTQTGYPPHWNNAKGLRSDLPSIPPSVTSTGSLSAAKIANSSTTPLDLDAIALLVPVSLLQGSVTIRLPEQETGVYSVSNRSFWLSDQQVLHIDQYSGNVIKHLTWQNVGVLMDLRQVFMRVHQGEYGVVNWLVVLLLVLTFTLSTLASMLSYLLRKPKGHWGLPRVPESFNADAVVVTLIALLGLLFPLFGASVVAIWLVTFVVNRFRGKSGVVN